MKYIKLLSVSLLCLSFLSECSQQTITQTPQNASWWERAKNYAISWIPQFITSRYRRYSASPHIEGLRDMIYIVVINYNKHPRSPSYIKDVASRLVEELYEDAIKYHFDPVFVMEEAFYSVYHGLAMDHREDLIKLHEDSFHFMPEKHNEWQDKINEGYEKEVSVFTELMKQMNESRLRITSSITNTVNQSATTRDNVIKT